MRRTHADKRAGVRVLLWPDAAGAALLGRWLSLVGAHHPAPGTASGCGTIGIQAPEW